MSTRKKTIKQQIEKFKKSFLQSPNLPFIDFQKLIFQNPSKIHKNRNKTPLKYIHLQAL
jgi:hypothetical protein